MVRHDVTRDPVPVGPFDLIHARLLLVHLSSRAQVTVALAGALAPGGRLVLEDADPALQPRVCIDGHGRHEAPANRMRSACRELLAGRGADLSSRRTLPRVLRGLGLVEVGVEACFPVATEVSAVLERERVRQLRQELVDSGRVTAAEIDELLVTIDDGRLELTTAPLVSAWGRRSPIGTVTEYPSDRDGSSTATTGGGEVGGRCGPVGWARHGRSADTTQRVCRRPTTSTTSFWRWFPRDPRWQRNRPQRGERKATGRTTTSTW